MEVVDAACQLNATANQVRQILKSQGYDICHNTLVREIERLYSLTFEEYRDEKVDLTRLKLVQKAVKMALEGNVTMLIFCLKNMCGWRDRNDPTVATLVPGGGVSLVILPDNERQAKLPDASV